MKDKGYSAVEDFKGKLKPWSKEGAAIARAAKKARQGKAGSGASGVAVAQNGGDIYVILTHVLAIVVAVLLADKFGVVPLSI